MTEFYNISDAIEAFNTAGNNAVPNTVAYQRGEHDGRSFVKIDLTDLIKDEKLDEKKIVVRTSFSKDKRSTMIEINNIFQRIIQHADYQKLGSEKKLEFLASYHRILTKYEEKIKKSFFSGIINFIGNFLGLGARNTFNVGEKVYLEEFLKAHAQKEIEIDSKSEKRETARPITSAEIIEKYKDPNYSIPIHLERPPSMYESVVNDNERTVPLTADLVKAQNAHNAHKQTLKNKAEEIKKSMLDLANQIEDNKDNPNKLGELERDFTQLLFMNPELKNMPTLRLDINWFRDETRKYLNPEK